MTELPTPFADIADVPQRESLAVRVAVLLTVVIPFLGLVAAAVMLWGRGIRGLELALLAAMYLATVLGVTVGYHRLFTHKAFETSRPVKFILAMLGSMAVQGPLLKWVAVHRRHHQHSDTHDDPHSPHAHGGGLIGVLKGFYHAHVGWLFRPDMPALSKYIPDLFNDRMLRAVSKLFPLWVAVGLLAPAIVGGLVSMSWTGAVLGFIWGGLVRVFLVHHVTWSINSVCHLWGTRPFKSHDESRNNFVFGVIGLGEGWHNNHHAFPASARHGLRWWEIDVSYFVIRMMSALRLAWDVRLPAQHLMAIKQAV